MYLCLFWGSGAQADGRGPSGKENGGTYVRVVSIFSALQCGVVCCSELRLQCGGEQNGGTHE